MWISESLAPFLKDVGVFAQSGTKSGWGILDMPSQVLVGEVIMSTDYSFICEASVFGALTAGASITVDSVAYTVREARLQDDGTLCELSLQKS